MFIFFSLQPSTKQSTARYQSADPYQTVAPVPICALVPICGPVSDHSPVPIFSLSTNLWPKYQSACRYQTSALYQFVTQCQFEAPVPICGSLPVHVPVVVRGPVLFFGPSKNKRFGTSLLPSTNQQPNNDLQTATKPQLCTTLRSSSNLLTLVSVRDPVPVHGPGLMERWTIGIVSVGWICRNKMIKFEYIFLFKCLTD